VPGPVLSTAPSSKSLIRLTFGTRSAQSHVKCSAFAALRLVAGALVVPEAPATTPAGLGLRPLSRLTDRLARARATGSARRLAGKASNTCLHLVDNAKTKRYTCVGTM
jgi:hypothetical protein